MARKISAAGRIAASLGAALAVLTAISAVHANDLMSMDAGMEIEGVARIGDRQVPLPAGKWKLVLAETDRRGTAKAGTAFLVQKADDGIVGSLLVRANLEHDGGRGWKRPNWCDRSNVHHNGSDNYHNKDDADCWILNHRVFTSKVVRVDFYNRIKDYLRKHGAASTFVGNMFRRNDAYDYLWVYHFVNPAAFGFPPERGARWVESKWHRSAVDGMPRRAFIDAVKAFGETYRDAFRQGFRGRLSDTASGLKFSFAR